MSGDAPTPETPGPAHHWANIAHAAHHKIRGAIAHDKHEHVVGLLERLEAELAPILAPLIDTVLDTGAMPPELVPLLEQARAPDNFSSSLVVGLVVGAALGPVIGTAVAPAVQTLANSVWPLNPVAPLSPEVLASGVARGFRDQGDAAGQAELSGIDAHRFDLLVDLSRHSPDLASLLALWRRRVIGDGELATGLEQSGLRHDWFDAVRGLGIIPMTPEEALEGWLEGQLDEGAAFDAYTKAGGDPEQFHDRYNIRGQAPTPTQALELLNRGVIAEGGSGPGSTSYEQAFLEGPWRNKWLGPFKALRRYIPPVRSIVAMIRSGALDDGYARTLLSLHGVESQDADIYIREAHTNRQESVRALTTAQVVGMYEVRMTDRGTASGRLTGMGWNAGDANTLLDYADERRTNRVLTTGTNKIGTLYVGWKIDRVTANNDLNGLGLPPDAITTLFAVWDIERTANLHHPTVAQVLGAYRREQIGPAETKQRLLALGVQQSDMAIIVADAFPPAHPDPALVSAVVNA